MTSRVLPREEWDRLIGTELETVIKVAETYSHDMLVLVVEDNEGVIVGAWSLMQCWHAEGLWIAPAHRGRVAVARRLLQLASTVATKIGFRAAFTAALTPDVATMLDKIATPLEGRHYVLPLQREIREESCQPPLQYH